MTIFVPLAAKVLARVDKELIMPHLAISAALSTGADRNKPISKK